MTPRLRFLAIIVPLLLVLAISQIAQTVVPLVIVSSFTSTRLQLTRQELLSLARANQVYTIPSWKNSVQKELDVGICTEEPENLLQALQTNSSAVAIIPWYLTQPQLRILRYHGHYFWEDTADGLTVRRLRWGVPGFKKQKVTVIAVGGTVVLSRGIGNVIDRTGDVAYPWQGLRALFTKADLAIANFKSPMMYSYVKPDSTWKLYGKARYAEGLKNSGIDLVSIAGNHIGDAGVRGIVDTVDILNKLGVAHAGIAETEAAAYSPVIKKLKNLTVGFMALNYVGPSQYAAGAQKYFVAGPNTAELKKQIQALKTQTDVIIVMPNWGSEYSAAPDAVEEYYAKFLTDQGVPIIVGDQAHWVQQIRFVNGSFVSYGLGNLIFDQSWSKETREGLVERFIFYGKELKSIDLMPVYLNDRWFTEVATDQAVQSSVIRKTL
jgi:poly-gamma-glutamate capsule biosynthesis protein CapA/YwtB (metallophosphatase superfamily)